VTLLPAAAAGLALYLPAHGLTPAAALGPSPALFISVLFFLGIVASWVGILLWSQMSRTLPSALAGQMIVFETIFAVIYAHILRREWPTALIGDRHGAAPDRHHRLAARVPRAEGKPLNEKVGAARRSRSRDGGMPEPRAFRGASPRRRAAFGAGCGKRSRNVYNDRT
jgi:hypothetical protein